MVDAVAERKPSLNYQLMIESSALKEKIKESTAAVEFNMKMLSSPSDKNVIDMQLIEQIKQRRRDQIERERSISQEKSAKRFEIEDV